MSAILDLDWYNQIQFFWLMSNQYRYWIGIPPVGVHTAAMWTHRQIIKCVGKKGLCSHLICIVLYEIVFIKSTGGIGTRDLWVLKGWILIPVSELINQKRIEHLWVLPFAKDLNKCTATHNGYHLQHTDFCKQLMGSCSDVNTQSNHATSRISVTRCWCKHNLRLSKWHVQRSKRFTNSSV